MESTEHAGHQHNHSYRMFAFELIIDFVIMYLVMYTMIDTIAHFHLNLNMLYMTLMMVSPMGVVMLLLMRSMFPLKKTNLAVIAGSALIFLLSFVAMRSQGGVGNADFLRSMIPHHSGAILMCQQATITDPRILDLCRQIVESQQEEIAQMEEILESL